MYIITYTDDEMWEDLIYKNIKPMYEVSTYGNVRNKLTGKMMSHCHNEKGYAMVGLMTDANSKRNKCFKTHLLVSNTFLDAPSSSEKLTVNHKNGNKDDNSIYNLEWVTFSENIKHSYREGLNTPRRGTLNGNNKYSEKMIREICELISQNTKPKIIRKYIFDTYMIEIPRGLIHDLKSKRTWVNLSNEYF